MQTKFLQFFGATVIGVFVQLSAARGQESAEDKVQQAVAAYNQKVDEVSQQLAEAKARLLEACEVAEKEAAGSANYKQAEHLRNTRERLDNGLSEHPGKPAAFIPSSAIQWPDGDGHHYKFFATPGSISWTDAQERCRRMGGHLACGETEEEFAFLYSIRVGKRSWLGGREVNGRWLWTTGGGAPIPAGKGGNNKFLATTRQAGTGARIARPDEANFVDGYLCEWDD